MPVEYKNDSLFMPRVQTHSVWRLQGGHLQLTVVNVTVHLGVFTKLGILAPANMQQPQMPAGMRSKNMFNLRKIVKKFLMNLKKTRLKFERAIETIKEEN